MLTLRRHYATPRRVTHAFESARQMSYPNIMWMRAGRWVAVVGFVPLLCAAAPPPPSAWVPVRWPWADARSLELLTGTPVNCLLLQSPAPELVAAAQARGVVALGVATPRGEAGKVDGALAAKVDRSEERRVGKECRSRWSP